MSIELVQKHATRIANGNARVQPGQPFRLNEAAAVGDGVWQGDLGVEIVAHVPAGYVESTPRQQLVPGNTIGSRHTIADLATVSEFSLPEGWSDRTDYDGLWGPSFVATKETTIEHPTHGDVIIAPGHRVRMRYQRNWDAEQQRERRSLD